jgi:hypothetical protein
MPSEMYFSYSNTIEESVTISRMNMPIVREPRPVTTYYAGAGITGDRLSTELPMTPQISVVARVRLWYQSPAELKTDEEGNGESPAR